ncbi:hypothetical protein BDV93DRAFT_562510 [Ceratobasidium sp. AG-I]|nr:hypothetical protein BDV93DRAFT_562510 [Ceratobasidium sp. AG-I]
MPPKRSNPSASADDGPPAKKAATKKTTTKKAATTKAPAKKGATKKTATKKAEAKKVEPKLKKSTAPNWEEHSEWSQEKPTGKWAKKCVERWCLLPPYDTSIQEKQWQTYHRERTALDKINTLGGGKSRSIESEDLGSDTWWLLRHAAEKVAAAILGSSLDDEEHKKRIARVLLGSLYFTGLDGQNEW